MRETKRVILEAVLIAVVGVVVALSANAANPHGLALGTDYFAPLRAKAKSPPASAPAAITATQAATAPTVTAKTATDEAAEVKAILERLELHPIEHDEAVTLFRDPGYAQGLYLFIDARKDDEYQAGHVPGALQLYYYEEQRYAEVAVALARAAEKVVIYCNGGECDDSLLTADLLRGKYAVDPAKLFVYYAGYEHWYNAGLPIERGACDSGDIVEGAR
ncbi:MAG: rhodanese-like domain-containing protein [Planctomycetes bacterium]|nr:rhodanese-like domain-containing protein [Planctomycetota bacterium]